MTGRKEAAPGPLHIDGEVRVLVGDEAAERLARRSDARFREPGGSIVRVDRARWEEGWASDDRNRDHVRRFFGYRPLAGRRYLPHPRCSYRGGRLGGLLRRPGLGSLLCWRRPRLASSLRSVVENVSDTGHPFRLGRAVVERFLEARFETAFRAEFRDRQQLAGFRTEATSVYFIGRRRGESG